MDHFNPIKIVSLSRSSFDSKSSALDATIVPAKDRTLRN